MKQQDPNKLTPLFRPIPLLDPTATTPKWLETGQIVAGGSNFACLSMTGGENEKAEEEGRGLCEPSAADLAKHPLALLAMVPRDAALFVAGAIAGGAANSVRAPLDRVKLLMQTHGLRAGLEGKKAIGFLEALMLIQKEEEGIKGYWKGNLPQVIRIIPYSAAQLFSYEAYKKPFQGKDGELSVLGRLGAGACAGMTSTLVTYPLDVLRLRLAVDSGHRTMSEAEEVFAREVPEET